MVRMTQRETYAFRLSPEAVSQLEVEAKLAGVSRSEMIRRALSIGLAQIRNTRTGVA